MYEIPTRLKLTGRVSPLAYKPRSNRFPSYSEKTLWKKGSRFGKYTSVPRSTAITCGVKRLPRWRIFCRVRGPRGLSPSIDSSQTTTPLASILPLRAFTLELSSSTLAVTLISAGGLTELPVTAGRENKKNMTGSVSDLNQSKRASLSVTGRLRSLSCFSILDSIFHALRYRV